MTMFGEMEFTNSSGLCYRAATAGFAPAAATTDILEIKHNGGARLIQVLEIWVAYKVTSPGATADTFFVLKRSTAATGGTPVAETVVPLDSGDGAAVSTAVTSFTANPTTGTLVGRLASIMTIPTMPGVGAATGIPHGNGAVLLFKAPPESKAGILRSSGQSIVVNCNGTIPNATSIAFSVLLKEVA